ncbi:protein YggU [Pseudomonas aeruginosa]|nr:protein YggU [Pseudomonas aeruginosa]
MEGKANAHLLAFLGKAFGVAKSLVSLESGELNRQKRVRIRRPTRLPEELGIAARPLDRPYVQECEAGQLTLPRSPA